jgi:hypothetical protein
MRFLRLFDCWSLGIDVSLYVGALLLRGAFLDHIGAFSFFLSFFLSFWLLLRVRGSLALFPAIMSAS